MKQRVIKELKTLQIVLIISLFKMCFFVIEKKEHLSALPFIFPSFITPVSP